MEEVGARGSVSIFGTPPNDHFVRVSRSILGLCDGDGCAAMLLALLESRVRVTGAEWIRYPEIELENDIMLYSRDTIRDAITLLERAGFISVVTRNFDRSRRIKLNADAVNRALLAREEAAA